MMNTRLSDQARPKNSGRFLRWSRAALLVISLWAGVARAQVPQLLNYQGRIIVSGTNFTGAGQFEFALVNTDGSVTYWSNDGSSAAGGEPAKAISLTVSGGLYSVELGDTTLANMTPVPYSVFANNDVRLRIWFNDGAHAGSSLRLTRELPPWAMR